MSLQSSYQIPIQGKSVDATGRRNTKTGSDDDNKVKFNVIPWDRSVHGYYSDMIRSGLVYLERKEHDHYCTSNSATGDSTATNIPVCVNSNDNNSGNVVVSTKVQNEQEIQEDQKQKRNGDENGSESSKSKSSSKSVVMLYESPSTSCKQTSFHNGTRYKFHDYPPANPIHKTFLAPCRYSMMNGNTYPAYLLCGTPPISMIQHWKKYIPDYTEPTFVSTIDPNNDTVYGYLPVECLPNNVNDPEVHYHLCGKDAIPFMTKNTPKVLSNTYDVRPCICKTTHSMGSKGIFIINNDADSIEFEQFLQESGNPPYVITEFVTIKRNIAAHFFVHPNGTDIVWIGSNENMYETSTGRWSKDSTIDWYTQNELQQLQIPFVFDVVQYLHLHNFWGFVGIDVLIDTNNIGWLVDVNPRCTGSSPAIMLFHILHQSIRHNCYRCLFRRTSSYCYPGTPEQLLHDIDTFNNANSISTSDSSDRNSSSNNTKTTTTTTTTTTIIDETRKKITVVAASFAPYDSTGGHSSSNQRHQEQSPKNNCTLVQLGVYGGIDVTFKECEDILNRFTVLTKSIAAVIENESTDE